MTKNKNLGQGLGALLTPSKASLEDFSQSSILISKIKPNPNQDYLIYQLLKLNVTMLSNHFELD